MEWVSIKDKMPTNTDDVLVIDKAGRMSVSCYFLLRSSWLWERRDDQLGLGSITHWMPLPEPPGVWVEVTKPLPDTFSMRSTKYPDMNL